MQNWLTNVQKIDPFDPNHHLGVDKFYRNKGDADKGRQNSHKKSRCDNSRGQEGRTGSNASQSAGHAGRQGCDGNNSRGDQGDRGRCFIIGHENMVTTGGAVILTALVLIIPVSSKGGAKKLNLLCIKDVKWKANARYRVFVVPRIRVLA